MAETLEVRCAGCGETLEVEPGLTEFACPDCATPQALPPELMPPPPPRPRRAVPLSGARLPCAGCGAALSVPRGLGRVACPQCGAELAFDGARLRLCSAASSSLAGGVAVIAPPASVTLASPFLRRPEAQEKPTSQAICVGRVQVERYNKAQGQFPNHSAHRDKSFSSWRADRTAINLGWAQKDPPNDSIHREESHIEPLNDTIARPDRMKTRLPVGPESIRVEKAQTEPPSQVSHVPQAQGGPSNYLVYMDQEQGQQRSEDITIHGKRKTGCPVVYGNMEHEEIEPLKQTVCAEHVQVEYCRKKAQLNKKTKGRNNKKKKKGLMSSSNEGLYLRCRKHLAKEPEGLIDGEPIQQPAPSPSQNQSDPPDIDRIISILCPSSSPQHQMPRASSNDSDNVDTYSPPAPANHGTTQVKQFLHCQMYSPEVRATLASRSSNSAGEHEMRQENSTVVRRLDKIGAQVGPNPWHDVMVAQQAQEPSSDDTHSDWAQVESPGKNNVEHHKDKVKGFMSLPNKGNHLGSDTHRQVTLAAACSRLATSLSLPTATPLRTTTLPSVLTTPPIHCNLPPSPHCQPSNPLHSQGGDSVLIGKSSKKRRGRGPTRLIEPRREADRPVLTPNNVDTWDVHPPCSKLASTISSLLKQWYPGSTYVPIGHHRNELSLGQVVNHWHQYHSDTRAIIMDEFLQRYKWAPGCEVECMKLFDRKAVRQFSGLLCDEKRRARVELAASKRANEALDAVKSNGDTALEEKVSRGKLKRRRRDEASAGQEDDDPLQWKPFTPEWMQPKWWEMLCEYWATEEVLQVSSQKRKNRYTGGCAQHTAGSRSIAMHRQIMIMENGGKMVSDIDVFAKTHKRDGGKGEFVTERARRTVEAVQRRMQEADDAQLDPHLVWAQEVGGRNRGRYYGLHGIIDKARIDKLARSIPGCFAKETQQQTFTQEQVQQMINQALQGLNETWEKKFQSIEQSVRGMPSSRSAPEHSAWSSAAGTGAQGDRSSCQDTSDSMHGEEYQSAKDDDESHGD